MQCACAVLSSVVCAALQSFSTLSHKRHYFRKIIIEHKICILIFFTTFVWNISHPKKKLIEIWSKMYIGRHGKYPLFLSDVYEPWTFSKNFRKITKYQISWKSVHPVGAELFHEDWRTDMTKLIVVFLAILRTHLKMSPVVSLNLVQLMTQCV
jgi:hypothetical protein